MKRATTFRATSFISSAQPSFSRSLMTAPRSSFVSAGSRSLAKPRTSLLKQQLSLVQMRSTGNVGVPAGGEAKYPSILGIAALMCILAGSFFSFARHPSPPVRGHHFKLFLSVTYFLIFCYYLFFFIIFLYFFFPPLA